MQEAVKDSGSDDVIVEDLAPIQEALVAGDDQAGAHGQTTGSECTGDG